MMLYLRCLLLSLINVLLCDGQHSPLHDVGIFNGNLVGLQDIAGSQLDTISTGFGLDRLALRQRLGRTAGLGIGVGGANHRLDSIPTAGLGLGLRPCPETCVMPNTVPDRCRFTPVHVSSSPLFGGYCLHCPIDLCAVGVIGGGPVPYPMGTGGIRADRRRLRRQRRRQRRRRLRRRICRHMGTCFGDRLGLLGAGMDTGIGMGIGPRIGNGIGTGFGPRIGTGIGAGFGPRIGNGIGMGFGPRIGTGIGTGFGPGIGMGIGTGIGPRIGTGFGRGIGIGMGPRVGTGRGRVW